MVYDIFDGMKFAKRKTLPFQNTSNFIKFGSSRPEVFCKKGVPRNLTKFTEKRQYQSLFLNKVAGQACNFIKKRLWCRCFPVNFVKFLRTPFLIEHLCWMLLQIEVYFTCYSSQNQFWFSFLTTADLKKLKSEF